MRKKKERSTGIKDVLFLQTDLKNHSKWFDNSSSKPTAVRARAEFADNLEEKLKKKHNFERLYWFGDGGMFYKEIRGMQNFNCAIEAGDTCLKVFSIWKEEKEDRQILQLRVSIHHPISPVYTHENKGYWTSEDLNVFSKYERNIAIPGTIAITNTVLVHLDKYQKRFPKTTERKVQFGNIKNIYYDTSLSPPKYPSKYSLISFLDNLTKEINWISDKKIGPNSKILVDFLDSIVLYAVESPSENLNVFLKDINKPTSNKLTMNESVKADKEAEKVRQEVQVKGQKDNKKVSPLRMVFPLTDFPVLTIEYYPELWSNSRAFQTLLEKDQKERSMWSRLAKNAADTQVVGFGYPGILCVHMLVRTEPNNKDIRSILLCQRNKHGPEGFFYEGKWSCSIEEQVRPGEEIEDCIMRGIKEELLGPRTYEILKVTTLAAFLERNYLNLTLLAAVDIPLSYEEIIDRWMKDAIDKNEHRQIVALPIQKDFVIKCLESRTMTSDVKKTCLVYDKETFRKTQLWDFHPTSPLRLATALWLENQ